MRHPFLLGRSPDSERQPLEELTSSNHAGARTGKVTVARKGIIIVAGHPFRAIFRVSSENPTNKGHLDSLTEDRLGEFLWTAQVVSGAPSLTGESMPVKKSKVVSGLTAMARRGVHIKCSAFLETIGSRKPRKARICATTLFAAREVASASRSSFGRRLPLLFFEMLSCGGFVADNDHLTFHSFCCVSHPMRPVRLEFPRHSIASRSVLSRCRSHSAPGTSRCVQLTHQTRNRTLRAFCASTRQRCSVLSEIPAMYAAVLGPRSQDFTISPR